jgi:hypothetical protein
VGIVSVNNDCSVVDVLGLNGLVSLEGLGGLEGLEGLGVMRRFLSVLYLSYSIAHPAFLLAFKA